MVAVPQPAPSSIYAARRQALMDAIGPNAVAVVRSLPERVRNGDSHYGFRQHSDVLYLTGFVEPDATVILRPGAAQDRVVKFVRPRDPAMEVWDGRRAGPEGATRDYGADDAFPVNDIDEILPGLMENRERVYYAMGHPEFDQRVLGWLHRSQRFSRGLIERARSLDLDSLRDAMADEPGTQHALQFDGAFEPVGQGLAGSDQPLAQGIAVGGQHGARSEGSGPALCKTAPPWPRTTNSSNTAANCSRRSAPCA